MLRKVYNKLDKMIPVLWGALFVAFITVGGIGLVIAVIKWVVSMLTEVM